ncbi:hypothetical protein LCGC14_2728470, partial [marine sediment metagenome]
MPKTCPEASEQLKTAIRAALLKRAPAYNRGVWEEDLAEEIQVHPNTIRNAIRAKRLINAAALWCLCEKFTGFEAEIYNKNPCRADSMKVAAEIAESLRAYADQIDRG